MGMLDRIKRKNLDGLKDFVLNMETTSAAKRQQIFTTGVLEDPIFMGWVMKNLRTFEEFLELPSEELEKIILSHEQILSMFAKALYELPEDKISEVQTNLPRLSSKLRDELSYLKDVPVSDREAARYYMLKTARKLQHEERISGFGWKLPPQDVFYPKSHKDGLVEIIFENGVLAAKGEYAKNRRIGHWVHYYETGKILAEGDYLDDLKTGQWSFYYGNGQLRSQGKFFADLRSGLWKEWDRKGEMTESQYKEGVKV